MPNFDEHNLGCVLSAGHLGMHHDPDGADWMPTMAGCSSSHQFPNGGGIEPIYFCELTTGHVGPHRALVTRLTVDEVQWP